jgi:UDP-N-acetylglucosamine enolpyruvyl transferase
MILHIPDSHLHSLPSKEEITTYNTCMRRISTTLLAYMKNKISSTPELCDILKLIEIISIHNGKLKKH